MRSLEQKSLVSADASTTQDGAPVDARYVWQASVQGVFTGSPVGTLKLQASNDVAAAGDQSPFTPTNWTTVAQVSVSGSGTYYVFDLEAATTRRVVGVCYSWIRVEYTATSGSGTVTAVLKTNGS